MPKDDINYSFTENGIVYDFYDVFVPAENFRQPTLFTWGNMVVEDLEQMILHPEILQSPHLPEEPLGNKFLVEGNIPQQSRPMGLYGFGVLVVMDDLEQIILQPEALQSPHLPEEIIGNRFLVEGPIQQQSKLMGLYGLGVLVLMEDLETILLQIKILQSPHLPEETIGNRFLVDLIERQQSRPMGLYGFGDLIVPGNLEQMIQTLELLQSPHLPEEMIGNQFL